MADISAVLRKVAPGANAAFIAASKNAVAIMERNGITSINAQADIIAHTAHESTGYKRFEENMNYSAKRLMQVWPSRFKTLAAAQPYAGNPRALANLVYGGRMGNRPNTDDGYNHRGSGSLQHTGRAEFERVTKRTGTNVIAMPALLRDPSKADLMWQAACTYYVDRGVLQFANVGDIAGSTKRINGGHIGLADRKVYLARAKAALAGKPIEKGAATTTEQADADQKNKMRATVGASAGGPTTGGGSAAGGTDYTTAIIIGVCATILLGLLAAHFWRRAARSQEVVEVQGLQTIQLRAEAA